ncbi:MAG: TIGR04283 family arsenosugar biosynthesis glycosyltransferase [Bryobacterales bacterium]|nr:TIGR04283 family arsenosugar biosynthesis glycosyltransferase [Bryobacterales bacterium]
MISVIIPTLNEAETIKGLLCSLRAAGAQEILVADGGSADATAQVAAGYAVVLRSPQGRAAQMNHAARHAAGEVLWFVHADTRVEPGSLEAIAQAMRDPRVVGGNFDIEFEGGDMPARAFGWVNRARYRFGVFYGDSGIFVRRAVFEEFRGYREWPILEDYELARRMWKRGRVVFLQNRIHVSSRRWRNGGLWTTLWCWFWIQALYLAGVPPRKLAAMYREVR